MCEKSEHKAQAMEGGRGRQGLHTSIHAQGITRTREHTRARAHTHAHTRTNPISGSTPRLTAGNNPCTQFRETRLTMFLMPLVMLALPVTFVIGPRYIC